MNILNEIAEKRKIDVEQQKLKVSMEDIKKAALEMVKEEKKFPFEERLKREGLNFICEVKKASPSKGIIAKDFPYLDIAKEYEEAGAAAISVLTEPNYFLGSDGYLKEIAKECSIPVLRKDFIIDPYQIYEGKVLGASAVLLICALLPKETLKEYMDIAESLGLSALVEVHDEEELKMALSCKARVIGVNNRNLKDFTVDIQNSIRLRSLVDPSIIFVSESGLKTKEDMKTLKEHHIQGALIGETFMRSENKKETLKELAGA